MCSLPVLRRRMNPIEKFAMNEARKRQLIVDDNQNGNEHVQGEITYIMISY